MKHVNEHIKDVLERFLVTQRKKQDLLDSLFKDFEHDKEAYVRKGVVHTLLAQRLNRGVGNDMVFELQAAIELLDGVYGFALHGRHFYRGLKLRPGISAPASKGGRKPRGQR